MASSSEQAIVELNGEKYSVVELPNSHSTLVKEGKVRLLGAIDLSALVDDLGRLGNFVRIAYHGVAGYTELQIKVQNIGYDVTKLCNKSAITVGKFKNASSTILSTLQATYQYLLDGLEDMAIETLADIAETAKGMADAARQLHDEFEYQSVVVKTTLEETQTQQGFEQKKKKEMEEERKKMEVNKEVQIKTHEEAIRQEAKAEALYQRAEEKEDRAMGEQNSVLKNMTNAVTSTFLMGKEVFKMHNYKEAAAAARAEKMEHLKKMNEQQEKRLETLQKLTEYAESIKNLKVEETSTEDAIYALQSAIGALKSLSVVMMQAATFWYQMQCHCEELAKAQMKTEIERALKMSEARRIKVWTSDGFKGKAVRYYANWVALDDVCSIYMERIKLTQQELYTYIQEALLPEEAHKEAKKLAETLIGDLKEQQEAITQKQFKHNQEILALQDEAKRGFQQ